MVIKLSEGNVGILGLTVNNESDVVTTNAVPLLETRTPLVLLRARNDSEGNAAVLWLMWRRRAGELVRDVGFGLGMMDGEDNVKAMGTIALFVQSAALLWAGALRLVTLVFARWPSELEHPAAHILRRSACSSVRNWATVLTITSGIVAC